MLRIVLPLVLCLLAGCIVVPPYAAKGGAGTVLLCHKNKKTMELPREAAAGHFKHGDRAGAC